MSSTNETTNYELSQFVGTDKPAWLTDYNQDMSKIDTAIKSASDTGTAADGKADANTTHIGDLTYLSTTAKNNLVAAINEVDTNADTAQASANANGAEINNLETYLDINIFANTTASATGANITANEIKYASNSAGTLGKIYGRLVLSANLTSMTVTFATGFRPSESINIDGVCIAMNATNNIQSIIPMTVATDGTVTINLTALAVGDTIRLLFPACLLFIKNFGD